jgi:molecular chaperone GrpE (heat shock protein)
VHNPDRVLLRKSANGTWIEVGVLTRRIKGKTWRMVLPDGSEVDHDIQSSESWAERGSFSHRLRTDPQGVAADLETSPGDVFRQVLAGLPKGAKAAQLKDALAGIDRNLVDKAWARAKKQLDVSDDVKRSDAKVPTYTLTTRPTAPDSVHAIERPIDPQPPATVADDQADAAVLSGTESTTSTHPIPADSPSSDTSEPRVRAGATTDPLVKFLIARGFVGSDEDLNSLSRRPLMLGQMLGRLKAKELSDLLSELDERHRVLLATVLGSGKEKLLEADAARVPQAAWEAVLRAGRREVAGTAEHKTRLLPSLTALMERATTYHSIPQQVLVDLAEMYGKEEQRRSRANERSDHAQVGLGKALEAAARSPEFNAPSASRDADMARLSQAARHAPFARTGGRSFLVATLFRQSPEQVRSRSWWEGATFDQLSEAGHGPLATALQDPKIAELVVRPLVDEALKQTETRSGLAQLISAPAPLARWVPGEGLKEALLRTGTRDEVASAWAEVLTDTRQLARMEDRLTAAQSAVRAGEEEQQDLQQRLSHLEHRLQVTGEELAAARAAQGDVRGVHERQVRADLIRVLAKIAAQVLQSPDASKDAGLMRSVSHAATREGLDAIGRVGQRSPFDPGLHDPMGQMISPEAQITVVRPGYTWRDGTEAVVLLKAQVVADGE